MRAVDRVATGWTMFVAAAVLIGAMLRVPALATPVHVPRQRPRRSRWSASWMLDAYSRPRPYDVTTIGRWQGYSLPSATVAVVGVHRRRGDLRACSCPAGRARSPRSSGGRRRRLVAFARLYLGVDHPFDVLVGIALGVGDPADRLPVLHAERGVPGHLPQGKTAHLDVGGRRGEAIRQAVEDQLGVTVRGHQAGRARRLGWLDPAAPARRRRSRHVPVREALRDEPRTGRPLVQARPHHPLRPAGGRASVPVRAPARPVRGLRHAPDVATPASRRPSRWASSS